MSKKCTKTSVPLRSLTDFIEEFDRYFSGSTQLKCYRGQRDSSWRNVAGIFRPDFKELLEDEKRAVRKLISVQPHEFASDETMFDKLVRMQHFGLPTRLLDVSRNAMVALFFATDPGPVNSKPSDGLVTAFAIPPELEKYYDSDSVSCIANLANMTTEEKAKIFQLKESLTEDLSETRTIELFNKDGVVERLLQFIRAEKSYFQPIMNPVDLFVPYYVHPKMSNRRILAQSGAFILYGIDPPKTMFFPYQIEQTSFIVPQGVKSSIREALDNIGINESTLFPEIDKAAAWIKNSYPGSSASGTTAQKSEN
ncbi:MAG: FRG domain-containing protein [Acidobacteriaceae bacterium]